LKRESVKAIINTRIVTESDIIQNGTIVIEDGVIKSIGSDSEIEIPKDCEITDAEGCYSGPGFVDIHCHGGGEDSAWESPAAAAAFHLRNGTTSLTLSIGYNLPLDETLRGIDEIKKSMSTSNPGNINGIFLEGPFINPSFGSSSKNARKINKQEYKALYERAGGTIRQWMYAPELKNGTEFARFVRSKDIPLAIGHTAASPETIRKAVRSGASICTHLFDAMGCHLGNDSVITTGIIQDTAADAALVTEELYLEIICDSRAVHVKPANLKLSYKCGGPDRVILITDYAVYNHKPSDYPDDDIRSAVDLNFNTSGELSGSRLTMDLAVKNMKHYTGASIPELFRMASANPAKAIGIFENVGSLELGKLANIVLLNSQLDLKNIFLKGEVVVV